MKVKAIYLLFFIAVIIFVHTTSSSSADFSIAVFYEQNFPTRGIPKGLTPEWILDKLGNKYNITFLNLKELKNNLILNADKFDLLVMPYGGTFPYEALNNIKEFLMSGGGIFNIAEIPFSAPVLRKNNRWYVDREIDMSDFWSEMGIRFYTTNNKNKKIKINQKYFPCNIEFSAIAKNGVYVTTGDKTYSFYNQYGNKFPFRIPCRDFFPLFIAQTLHGETTNIPAIFIKNWRNIYKQISSVPNKWCFITLNGKNNPLSPNKPHSCELLNYIFGYLSAKQVIYDLNPDMPIYRETEKPIFSIKMLNYDNHPSKLTFLIRVTCEEGDIIWSSKSEHILKANEMIEQKIEWPNQKFNKDFYHVEAFLLKNGQILDYASNGLLVYAAEHTQKRAKIFIYDNKFYIGTEEAFINGTNYYESKMGELLWVKPNLANIRDDFLKMKNAGINYVRIHYHHSKWFRDYYRLALDKELDNFFDVCDKTSLPSERSLRIIDAILQLANKNGLILCLDIFTLLPVEMGDPRGWLGLTERIYDKSKITIQKEFIKILAERYKDHSWIIWDLWNEPRLNKTDDIEQLKRWAADIKKTFRSYGDHHLITLGDNSELSFYLKGILDFASVHSFLPLQFPAGHNYPFIFHEVWVAASLEKGQECIQNTKLKENYKAAEEAGAIGFVPWQWTRQSRLWDDLNNSEKWDNDLGAYMREDGTFKFSPKN